MLLIGSVLKRAVLCIAVLISSLLLTANGGQKQETPTPPPQEFKPIEYSRDGRLYRKGIDGKEMVLIPAGTFMMGTSPEEIEAYLKEYGDWKKGWFLGEEPKHQVTLKSFWMDATEITNAEFAGFMETTGYRPEGEWFLDLRKVDLPAVYVAWDDAQAYCRWVGGRLPTEAEWEYAAGGPEGYRWSLSNAFDAALYSFNRGYLEAVGRYGANGYGLYDMSGSVWEWVGDWYDRDYYRSSPQENPAGPESGVYRVIRGGAWDTSFFYLRTGSRSVGVPANRLTTLGFRCVSETR
jgi:iron(II)-dependent oxidoreductase